MSLVRPSRVVRRAVAAVQLLLFVVSTSAVLLPCAHSDSTHSATSHAASSHSAATADVASHEAMMHHEMAPSHDRPQHTAPHAPSPTAPCPWVIGCVGMLRIELDATWRTTESLAPTHTPSGVTLAYVTVVKDIESPPPRA